MMTDLDKMQCLSSKREIINPKSDWRIDPKPGIQVNPVCPKGTVYLIPPAEWWAEMRSRHPDFKDTQILQKYPEYFGKITNLD